MLLNDADHFYFLQLHCLNESILSRFNRWCIITNTWAFLFMNEDIIDELFYFAYNYLKYFLAIHANDGYL